MVSELGSKIRFTFCFLLSFYLFSFLFLFLILCFCVVHQVKKKKRKKEEEVILKHQVEKKKKREVILKQQILSFPFSRSNPFEERGNDGNQSGPVTRSRAKKIKEAMQGLVQSTWDEASMMRTSIDTL